MSHFMQQQKYSSAALESRDRARYYPPGQVSLDSFTVLGGQGPVLDPNDGKARILAATTPAHPPATPPAPSPAPSPSPAPAPRSPFTQDSAGTRYQTGPGFRDDA